MSRQSRSDAGKLKITERDLLILPWIIEMQEVPINLLRFLLARYSTHTEKPTVSIQLVYQQVARWEKFGWVKSRNPFDNPKIAKSVYATAYGIKFFDYSVRPSVIKETSLPHTFAVCWVRLWIEKWMQDNGFHCIWRSERLLRSEKIVGFIPDAEVTYGGVTVAIEVEISAKAESSYKEIARTYFNENKCIEMWYFHNRRVEPILTKVFGGLEPRFQLKELHGKTLGDGSTFPY